MTSEELKRGKEIAEQIEVLQRFVNDNMEPLNFWRLWFRRGEADFKSKNICVQAQFRFHNAGVEASERLSQRIMRAIVDELADLKAEFENIGEEGDGGA